MSQIIVQAHDLDLLTLISNYTEVRNWNCLRITFKSDLSKCPSTAFKNLDVAHYAFDFFLVDEHLSDIRFNSYFLTVPNENHITCYFLPMTSLARLR